MLLFCAVMVITAPAQTFTSLLSFDGTHGENPVAPLVQGFNGDFYGTTRGGGHDTTNCLSGCGTVFEITAAGVLTTLYEFCAQSNCSDGTTPQTGLVQTANGNFYGTTSGGGANGLGTVFEITPKGKLTTLYSFCSQSDCTDSYGPNALVQAANGNFYGTTNGGGANGVGTVFEITPAGKLTTLYSFCSQSDCADGEYPFGALIQATNGNFYGTTSEGGAGFGTVFEITPAGKLTTLHTFCAQSGCKDGGTPAAGLVQAANGNLYGTTSNGGANSYYGTVFEITPAGTLTTLYSFCSQFNCPDGSLPAAELVQATNGNFYGTTSEGGANCLHSGCGTLFEITPAGGLTTLYSFCSQSDCADGGSSSAALVQSTNGNFYGTTGGGGNNSGYGTVFSESVGLGPFVETLSTSGKVGAAVTILGNSLSGATAVSFNGTLATFTVVSSTEIKTTVPSGATTGSVAVTLPAGTLKSNKNFRVTPQILSFSPPSGPVGTLVTITGVSVTQTTSVAFGGIKAASFTVNSDTQVTATVPAGAKTGKIGIVTKGGVAVSSGTFTVTN
jgi:uncharacterized repeat protein (TIGR03803 family)